MTVWGWGLLIGIALVLIIWFVFVAPMERQMHNRKMELMRRKLQRNEERLQQLQADEAGQATVDEVGSPGTEERDKTDLPVDR